MRPFLRKLFSMKDLLQARIIFDKNIILVGENVRHKNNRHHLKKKPPMTHAATCIHHKSSPAMGLREDDVDLY